MKKKLFAIVAIMAMLATLPSCDNKRSSRHHDDEDEDRDEKTEKVDERRFGEGVREVTVPQPPEPSETTKALKDALANEIEQGKSELPVDLGAGMQMVDASFDGAYAYFTLAMPYQMYNEVLSQPDDYFIKTFVEGMGTGALGYKQADVGIVLHVVNKDDGNSKTYTIEASEI